MNDDFIIVGTAGHIDHGKTTLVRALTGVDTDRLKEEKERGISIDLGFAPLVLPSGKRLGVVDVPGHERFIRNMLAGAGGVDLILLVIDAREGVMPQTREHLAILDMLDIRDGLVVVTKKDLVDAEWLDLVHQEVLEALAGTFLQQARLVDVSAVTGEGIEQLLAEIDALTPRIRRKSRSGPFRMPIDRVISVQGIGTVVTGTVWRGEVRLGQALELFPGGGRVRVRSLESHAHAQDALFAGQRAAIALTGAKQSPHRGMVLGEEGAHLPTRLLDARVRVLQDAPVALAHRDRVRLYLGTAEVLGRVLLLESDELAAGEDGLVQITLESDLVAEAKDHFVLRSYSPMRTIGGGTVIRANPPRLHRRRGADALARLLRAERGTTEERVLEALAAAPFAAASELTAQLGEAADAVSEAIRALRERGELVAFGDPVAFVPRDKPGEWAGAGVRALEDYFAKSRYDLFASRSVFVQALRSRGLDARRAEDALRLAVQEDAVELRGERVTLAGRSVALTAAEEAMRVRVLTALEQGGFNPPGLAEVQSWFAGQERMLDNVLHVLEQEGLVAFLAPDVPVADSVAAGAAVRAQALFAAAGPFTVAQFRDAVGTSRKYAVALLEYLDRQKVTRRAGDAREYIGSGGAQSMPGVGVGGG